MVAGHTSLKPAAVDHTDHTNEAGLLELALSSAAFWVSMAAAAIMGFAIQRGATCTVAAVDEVLTQRKTARLLALIEASVWVAAGLALAYQLGWLKHAPTGFALTAWTVLGAVLLGLGAFVNRACVFGAIARLGSGEWAYLFTPLGFYAGCVSVPLLFAPPAPQALAAGSLVFDPSSGVLWGLLAGLATLLVVRGAVAWRKGTPRLWSPRTATIVIRVMFVVTLVLAGGTWGYTDLLADLARNTAPRMTSNVAARTGLALALLCGALIGGWQAGLWRPVRIAGSALLRCFCGGLLMGWGSLLIPGSNDGLILIGMPLLWPYAWVAFAVMCLTIAAALRPLRPQAPAAS